MEKQQRANDGKSTDRKILSEVGEHGVAIITINRPPLNLLSVDVVLSLKEKIEEAIRKDSVKAIVITGSRGNFSAGFVVTAFGGSQQRKTHRELGFMSIDFITDTLEGLSCSHINIYLKIRSSRTSVWDSSWVWRNTTASSAGWPSKGS